MCESCEKWEKMDEETKFWIESEDDNICIEGLNLMESSMEWNLLNDGQDDIFHNLPAEPPAGQPNNIVANIFKNLKNLQKKQGDNHALVIATFKTRKSYY